MMPASEALDRLRAGNRRFASADDQRTESAEARRQGLVAGQSPVAVILGCSDSRVPPEIIFDQGLGDLFVVRAAGNVAAPSQVGSVEFAVSRLGTRLVVVLGHSGCGAVLAALEEQEVPSPPDAANLNSILRRIQPSADGCVGEGSGTSLEDVVRCAVRENVKTSIRELCSSSILKELLEEGGLRVVGAEYSLETGVVDFLDDTLGTG